MDLTWIIAIAVAWTFLIVGELLWPAKPEVNVAMAAWFGILGSLVLTANAYDTIPGWARWTLLSLDVVTCGFFTQRAWIKITSDNYSKET